MAATSMGVKLDEKTRNRLKKLGKLRQRTPHWLMRTAIMEFLDREERSEKERHQDMKRWRAYQRTGDSISNEAMMDFLDTLEEELH